MKTNILINIRVWAIMIVCLTVLGVGNAWGATDTKTYDGSDLSGWSGTHSGQYADGSLKLDATGETAYKYDIWSGVVSTGMTSITVTINYKINGSGSSSNVFTVAAVNSSGTVKASQTFAPTSTSYTDAEVTLTIPASSAVTGLQITSTTKSSGNVGISSLKAVATYTSTYTATIARNNTSYGTVSTSSVGSLSSGAAITKGTGVNINKITIGGTTVTATPAAQYADYDYAFSSWTVPGNVTTVTADITITANFTRTARPLTNYRTICCTPLGSINGSFF